MSALRHLFAATALVAAVTGLLARADSNGTTTPAEDTAVRQAQLKRAFEQFRARLAVVAGRMENSSDTKERERAKALRTALKEASSRGTEMKFDSLIRALKPRGADQNLDVLNQVVRENKELREDLKKLISLLTQDDRDKLLKDRREEALRLLETLKDLRDKQARMQAQTEMKKLDNKELNKNQKKITDSTKGLLDKLDKPTNDSELAKKMQAVKKPVGEANSEQKKAEGKLGMNNNDGASDSQGKAVSKLDEAIKEVEDLINQTRKEEQERKLLDLLARAKKMLDAEKEILTGTETLSRELSKQKDAEADVAQAARSNKLAERQLDNLRDGDAALKIIRDEGSAAAFQEIFEQVVKDMDAAQRRFGRVEVDTLTVAIVTDVVETLKDVVKALEKAIKENENGPKPPPGPSGPSPKPKLVSLLNQLKMIHAMQKRVNARTELYGKQYNGEQLPKATTEREKVRFEGITKELKDLSGRQDRLAKVTREVGKQGAEQRID